MKLFTFNIDAKRCLGAQLDGLLVNLPLAWWSLAQTRPVPESLPPTLPPDLQAALRMGPPALAAVREALAFAARRPPVPAGETLAYPLDAVRLLPPVPRPGKILCADPAPAFDGNARSLILPKLPNTLVGPGDPIRHPGPHFQVTCEPRLAAIVGTPIPRGTRADRILTHVAGFTLLNDLAATGPGIEKNAFFLQRNLDSFCAVGPCLVTTDELPSPAGVALRALRNGDPPGDAAPAAPILELEPLLEQISAAMSLEPGDIIALPTPPATPRGFTVKPGDVVRIEADAIGILENRVVHD